MIFATYSGLWGVLVIDMVQLVFMMVSFIAAAYFAVNAPGVGGMRGMLDTLSTLPGPGGIDYLAMLPDFTNHWDMAVAVFIIPIAVQWWSVWYPGSEPEAASLPSVCWHQNPSVIRSAQSSSLIWPITSFVRGLGSSWRWPR